MEISEQLIDEKLLDFSCAECQWGIRTYNGFSCEICDGKGFGSKKCRNEVKELLESQG